MVLPELTTNSVSITSEQWGEIEPARIVGNDMDISLLDKHTYNRKCMDRYISSRKIYLQSIKTSRINCVLIRRNDKHLIDRGYTIHINR